MGRLAAYAQAVRAENPFTLFVDAGDDHEKGSVAEELSHGASTKQVVDAMGFDVRVLGNHDFGWGPAHLLDFSRDPTALVLSSNVEYVGSSPSDFGGTEYGELDVGCLRVGFFGMVTRPWAANDRQVTADYFPEFSCRYDYVARAEELVQRHRSQVDLLVMVSHLGIGTDQRIAERVSGIDLILGGHTHTVLAEPHVVAGTVVVHAGSHGSHVARLDLTFDLQAPRWLGYTHELLSNQPRALPSDPALEARIAQIAHRSAPHAQRSIFRLERDLSRLEVSRLAAEASVEVLDADAAFIDPARVQKQWPSGGVSQQELLDTFQIEHHPPGTPGDTSMYVASMTGRDLLRLRRERSHWGYAGPTGVAPSRQYSVGLQKHMALHAMEYLPTGIRARDPEFASDLWRVVELYGSRRVADHLGVAAALEGTPSPTGPLLPTFPTRPLANLQLLASSVRETSP
jgi:2',3'-cyclic-nucleotide 2'-phosphodiesterase (5'-nucleotidase family)